ncbi:MAG: hypothetical protein WDA22_08785 [Bacteroidota bacterium]
MGLEAKTKITIGKNSMEGKVLLESSEVIIHGKERMRIPFNQIKTIAAADGVLRFSFGQIPIQIVLGLKAEKWLEKIKNPKTVFDKLGVKRDAKISVVNVTDKSFIEELKKRVVNVAIGKTTKKSDLIFYEANSSDEVQRLSSLKKYLTSNGGIWVVSLKGKSATIKDVEVMAVGKKCGLVDVKVVGFSETHTALKFVIPATHR